MKTFRCLCWITTTATNEMKRSATKTWENIISSRAMNGTSKRQTCIRNGWWIEKKAQLVPSPEYITRANVSLWESVSRWDHTFLFIKSFAIIISFLCFFKNCCLEHGFVLFSCVVHSACCVLCVVVVGGKREREAFFDERCTAAAAALYMHENTGNE